MPQYEDPDGRLNKWVAAFVRSNPTDTLSLLKDLSAGVAERIRYQSREVEGTQAPLETLDRGWGSCRDFAVLFVGCGADAGLRRADHLRLSLQSRSRPRGLGRCRLDPRLGRGLLPGAGWITFDPTNRSVGGHNLIPVAVARDIHQATPVTGSFIGMTDSFRGMWVEVSVLARTAPLRDGEAELVFAASFRLSAGAKSDYRDRRNVAAARYASEFDRR